MPTDYTQHPHRTPASTTVHTHTERSGTGVGVVLGGLLVVLVIIGTLFAVGGADTIDESAAPAVAIDASPEASVVAEPNASVPVDDEAAAADSAAAEPVVGADAAAPVSEAGATTGN